MVHRMTFYLLRVILWSFSHVSRFLAVKDVCCIILCKHFVQLVFIFLCVYLFPLTDPLNKSLQADVDCR